MSADDLQAILAAIADIAGSTVDQAQSLPAAAYTSEALLEHERDRIFRKEWICVGRSDEIPNAGDFFPTKIDTVPLIILRRDDGSVGAMSNTCLHRMATLVADRGCEKSLSCPYHGWTYDLDGHLIAAPRMGADFDMAGRRLRQARTELWGGFIYVSLCEETPPLAPRLKGLESLLANYHIDRMRTVRHRRHVWNTNWKILTENFLEAYHIPVTHPETLASIAPYRNVRMLPRADGYHFYEHRLGASYTPLDLDPAIAIPNSDLSDADKSTAYVGGVFPSHVFSVSWDWVAWLSLQPCGIDHVIVDWGIAAPIRWTQPGEPDPTHPNLYYLDLLDAINEEDRQRVESIQRGAQSGWGQQSRLHPYEATIWGFAHYLTAQLS